MKRVSFKVAQAIKEAGYPQDYGDFYYDYNKCIQKRGNCYVNCKCVAPTYIEVGFWLWREKKISISTSKLENTFGCLVLTNLNKPLFIADNLSDPEEAIIAAIEYLVDKDLIK